jgi:uncharacterized protein (TIGR04255 family)
MASLRRKLKTVPISEAIFDIRFTCGDLPELVVGVLAPRWKGWAAQRLPVAEIPSAIRKVDPNLQFQPVIEFRSPDHPRIVRLSDQSVSYHALAPYPGWSMWSPELIGVIDFVFSVLENFSAIRLGLRYINVLSPTHFVADIRSLNFSASVGGAPLDVPLNLNYQEKDGDERLGIVRIASKEFIVNQSPAELVAVIDVDVFTPTNFQTNLPTKAKSWLEEAHEFEKRQFFRLLDEALISKLREE